MSGQGCWSTGFEADRFRRLIKFRELTIKLAKASKDRMKLVLQLAALLGKPFVLSADFASAPLCDRPSAIDEDDAEIVDVGSGRSGHDNIVERLEEIIGLVCA